MKVDEVQDACRIDSASSPGVRPYRGTCGVPWAPGRSARNPPSTLVKSYRSANSRFSSSSPRSGCFPGVSLAGRVSFAGWPIAAQSPSCSRMASANSAGLSARRNGTQPALMSLAVRDQLQAAHQRPVSLSQMPQRSSQAASIVWTISAVLISVAVMRLPGERHDWIGISMNADGSRGDSKLLKHRLPGFTWLIRTG